MDEKKADTAKVITHSSYELLRRLPSDAETIITMCASLKENFAEKQLIESVECKEQRNRYRKTPKMTSRRVLPEVHQILSDTAADLDIQVQQVITLLVFLHGMAPSWTVRRERMPRRKTIKSRKHNLRPTTE